MEHIETYFNVAAVVLAILAVKCGIVIAMCECTIPARRAYLRNTGKRTKFRRH